MEIKDARADGRLCEVFRSKEHYETFRKQSRPRNLTEDEERKGVEDLLRGYIESD